MTAKEIPNQMEKTRYSQFCQEITSVKSAFKNKYQKDVKLDEEIIRKRSQEGKPLIDRENIEIDEKLLNELFQSFLPVFKKHQNLFTSEIQDLEQKKKKIDIRKLARSVLIGELDDLKSLALELSLNPDLLFFLGLNLTQTLLELYAHGLKGEIDPENWLKGNCPICGSFPAMEKLNREDGKRVLWCGLCGTEWHYKRLMCPFCGNEDHNRLRYFLAEGDLSLKESPFRVDLCDQCKKYIKTIDERKIPENEVLDFALESINTLYLDVLAQKDGYQSPTRWMIG